jgi:Ca-activated chloride channel family protein
MLTLAYPWLLALLPLPLAVWWFVPPYSESREGLRVPFLDRLARLTGQEPTAGAVVLRGGWVRSIALAGVWVCLVAALARPQWLEPPISRTVPVRDMMLVVDLSGSMETKDFTDPAGQKVDRLTAVKQVLDDFLTRRKGDRVGLIVFGNAPFVQAPFTDDLNVCRELLAETRVGMAGPKTALGDAIGLAITVFDRSDVRDKVLIALTDGNDTGSQVPPEKAAAVAKDKGVTIHTVAVGDPKAAGEDKLDEEALKRVASVTGGTYSHAGSRAELEAVYRRLDDLPTRPAETITHRPRRDLFHWPLAAGLALSFVPAGVGLLLESRLQPVRAGEPAKAGTPTDRGEAAA